MFSLRHNIFLWCFVFVFSVLLCGESFAQSNRYENSQNYKNAVAALDNDDLESSYDFFMKEVAVHPDNGYAFFYISSILYGYENLYPAFQNINKSIEYLPSTDRIMLSKAYLLRAKIQVKEDALEGALEDLNYAMKLTPKELDLYQLRAEIYSQKGQYDESDADYRMMSGLHPGYAISEIGLASNDLRRGNYNQAIAQLDKIVRKYPDYSRIYALRAEAYYGLNRIPEAADDLIQSLAIDNNKDAILLMANIAVENSAILKEKISDKHDADYNNSMWPFYLGFVNEISSDMSAALVSYMESYQIDNNTLSAGRIAVCFRKMKDWEHALEYIDKVIRIKPEDPDGYHMKADIHWYSGQPDKAAAVMAECIGNCPDNHLNYRMRGYFKELSGDLDGAVEDYSEALDRNPEDVITRMLRGHIYYVRKYSENADSDFELCVKLDTVPSASSIAPFALYYLDRKDEANAFMDAVSRFETTGASYRAACYYSMTGRKSLGLEYLEKLLKGGYDNYNHLLKEEGLSNVRGEVRFKQLFERYSQVKMLPAKTEEKAQQPQKKAPKPPVKKKPTYTETVSYIPYTFQHGIRKVAGTINGFKVTFSYLPKSRFLISAYQAEYFLANGYIDIKDISGSPVVDGKIPVGSKIKLTLKIGDEVLDKISAEVVSNDHSPLVFGNNLFSGKTSVTYDDNRKQIIVTTKTYNN